MNESIVGSLNRIEGQVRGVKQMFEAGRGCDELMVQLSALNAAVISVARNILTNHITHCVVEGIQNGKADETVETLIKMLDGYLKIKK